MAKQMAKAGETALTLPEDLPFDDMDDGMEAADRDSYAIPFLVVLQKGTPQADPDNEAYIDGAKAGMLYDSVSGQVMDPAAEDIFIIPCFFRRAFVEWRTREEKGGFVAEHDPVEGARLLKSSERDDKNRDMLPNGNQLVDTRYHYVVLVRGDVLAPMVITMSSTQVKNSKRLMSDLRLLKDSGQIKHTVQVMYQVSTVTESNEHGTWRSWKIQRAGFVSDQKQLETAAKFYQAIKAGEVREATETIDSSGGAASTSDSAATEEEF